MAKLGRNTEEESYENVTRDPSSLTYKRGEYTCTYSWWKFFNRNVNQTGNNNYAHPLIVHYTCTYKLVTTVNSKLEWKKNTSLKQRNYTYFFAFIPGAMLAALWRCEFTGGFTNRLGAGLRGGVRGGEQSSSCSALSRSSAMLSSTGRPPLPVDPTLSMGQAYDALLSLSSHEVPGIIVARYREYNRMITEYENLENIFQFRTTFFFGLYLEIIFHILFWMLINETRLHKLYMNIHINKCLSVLHNYNRSFSIIKVFFYSFLIEYWQQ